ncbi:MAG: hypothetical protein ACRDQ4_20200 [Pseudonocardiaceae bacterium]
MRILVGNDLESDGVQRPPDTNLKRSAFSNRILYFARPGDVLVLPAEPDEAFVGFVLGFLGLRTDDVVLRVAPPGRFNRAFLDPLCVDDALAGLDITAAEVSEVFVLWPNPDIAAMAARMGWEDKYPGHRLIAGGGGAFVNSKAAFRAIGNGIGVSLPEGRVCHQRDEAALVLSQLLHAHGGAVLKQDLNAAGAGNRVVVAGDEVPSPAQSGHRGVDTLPERPSVDDIERCLARNWAWASSGDRRSVVIEQYVPDAETAYFEFFLGDTVSDPKVGRLLYSKGRLIREDTASVEVFPRHLRDEAQVIAETYHGLGYRGYLSADAVLTSGDQGYWTEVNARVTGSTHLYGVLKVIASRHSSGQERRVTQFQAPTGWLISSTADFLDLAKAAGVLYDPAVGSGVVPVMPIDGPGFLFACIYVHEEQLQDQWNRLERRATS